MPRSHQPRAVGAPLALAIVLAAAALAVAQDAAPAPAPAPAPTSQPTTQQDDAAKLAQDKKTREDQLKNLPQANVKSLRDAIQFAIENDQLIIRTSIPPTEMSAVVVDGKPTLMSVSSQRGEDANTTPYVPMIYALMSHEYPPGGVAITQASVIGQRVTLSKSSEGNGEMRNVELLQDDAFLEESDDRVRMYVQEDHNEERIVDLKLSAVNVTELRRKYPAETMRYLEPIFRDFGQASVLFQVNTRAAWQVLGDTFTPPADVAKQVDALLVKLDADDPKVRDAALKDLETLGQPAALVLMKRDRKGLSEEQQARVETFLAPYKPLSDPDAAKMREDPEFLLVALSSDDAALAGRALEQLKQVARQPISFDLSTTGQARTEAIAALRAKLLPATTRPATTKTVIKSSSESP
jgi:hypothetical protein